MIEYQALTKFLGEKQAFLWASLLTGMTLFVLSRNGYADHLEKSVVTTVIAGGIFAGFLLVSMGAGWAIERGKSARALEAEKKKADAEALKVFDDLFDEHRMVLQYVATDCGKPNFKAGTQRVLAAMLELNLLELDGPGGFTRSGTYYRVRDVIWERMMAENWQERPKWPDEHLAPWDDEERHF